MTPDLNPVDFALALYARKGEASYGEGVTQNAHALQSAALARAEGAAPELVAAALLHDIGHLLQEQGEDAADRGIDTRHEAIGARWLTRVFGRAVAEPVALHVAAKRYLCTSNPAYEAALSDASRQSLALQGGPMTQEQAAAFIGGRAAAGALRLRHWDDLAKDIDRIVPGFAEYRELLLLLYEQRLSSL